ERTGIRERRIAAPEEAFTDLALPAARAALAQADVEAADLDLLLCATVTPDMMFPTSSALLADTLGASDAAAYDLLAGCTGFMYALVQAYGMIAAGLADRALVVGGDVLSRILDWTDRSTLVLFGDGAGSRTGLGAGFDGMDRGKTGPGAFCLPGQGSVEVGMGREIAEAVPEAMDVFERSSIAAGLDLQRLCFGASEEELVETEVQQ